jgi:hypothetical protein
MRASAHPVTSQLQRVGARITRPVGRGAHAGEMGSAPSPSSAVSRARPPTSSVRSQTLLDGSLPQRLQSRPTPPPGGRDGPRPTSAFAPTARRSLDCCVARSSLGSHRIDAAPRTFCARRSSTPRRQRSAWGGASCMSASELLASSSLAPHIASQATGCSWRCSHRGAISPRRSRSTRRIRHE